MTLPCDNNPQAGSTLLLSTLYLVPRRPLDVVANMWHFFAGSLLPGAIGIVPVAWRKTWSLAYPHPYPGLSIPSLAMGQSETAGLSLERDHRSQPDGDVRN